MANEKETFSLVTTPISLAGAQHLTHDSITGAPAWIGKNWSK
jgi:hypothetical protein